MSTQVNNQFVTEIINQSHKILDEFQSCGVLSNTACDKINKAADGFFRDLAAITSYTGEAYWKEFSLLFGFARQPPPQLYIPMNAANLCPEPAGLLDAINLMRAEYNKNVAQQTRMEQGIRVLQLRRSRKALAQSLNCNLDDLAIVRNGSEGNNAINCGYRKWKRVKKADDELENVVLWSENHPTNLEVWKLRAEWESEVPLFEVRVVEIKNEDTDERIASKFIDKINKDTRFVSFSQTSNGSGFSLPLTVLRRIKQHVDDKRLDCHIHIDGTMAWGSTPIDLSICHSFISSAHKWFLGPKQTGILYMHKEKVNNFVPSIFAYDYKIDIPKKWEDMPKNAHRFEMLGQRDDVDIIALYWTQRMWDILVNNARGYPDRNPYRRVSYLATQLKSLLHSHGWDIITPMAEERSGGVVRVNAPRGKHRESLYHYIYKTHKISGSVGGKTPQEETFRLCPHIYNTLADVQRAVTGMEAWRKNTQ